MIAILDFLIFLTTARYSPFVRAIEAVVSGLKQKEFENNSDEWERKFKSDSSFSSPLLGNRSIMPSDSLDIIFDNFLRYSPIEELRSIILAFTFCSVYSVMLNLFFGNVFCKILLCLKMANIS